MNVRLYQMSAPAHMINKDDYLTKVGEDIPVIFKEDNALDVINPSILLNYASDASDMVDFNYVEIPKFNRFYFINSISSEGGLTRINCHCDVLHSFKSSILASTQYIERSESSYDRYLPDEKLPLRSRPVIEIEQFGDPVYDENCNCVVLETIGKGEGGVD